MEENDYNYYAQLAARTNCNIARLLGMSDEEIGKLNVSFESKRKSEALKRRAELEAQEKEREEKMAQIEAQWEYRHEPEPYAPGMFKDARCEYPNGTYIREDLKPQDPSNGLKLTRIGSYCPEWTDDGHPIPPWKYNGGEDYFLEFDDGSRLESFHYPDLSETNYADFPHMQVMGEQAGNRVNARDLTFFPDVLNSIIPIKDLGFYIVTMEGICILVSCYSFQNGYYSTSITLKHRDKLVELGKGCAQWVSDYYGDYME